MKTLSVMFNDEKHTVADYTVVSWEVHTYGFLELKYNGYSEFINLSVLFSFKGQN